MGEEVAAEVASGTAAVVLAGRDWKGSGELAETAEVNTVAAAGRCQPSKVHRQSEPAVVLKVEVEVPAESRSCRPSCSACRYRQPVRCSTSRAASRTANKSERAKRRSAVWTYLRRRDGSKIVAQISQAFCRRAGRARVVVKPSEMTSEVDTIPRRSFLTFAEGRCSGVG